MSDPNYAGVKIGEIPKVTQPSTLQTMSADASKNACVLMTSADGEFLIPLAILKQWIKS